ncbi:TPA: hypothetical protein JS395_003461, partial [Serratia marcescens]|nr:hypothetical protein [Serratia marcescens]
MFPVLAIAAATGAKTEESITVTATAQPIGSYSADTASTAGKTAAPIAEVPQSVSVVTSQV